LASKKNTVAPKYRSRWKKNIKNAKMKFPL
jgi:hypothetical protein